MLVRHRISIIYINTMSESTWEKTVHLAKDRVKIQANGLAIPSLKAVLGEEMKKPPPKSFAYESWEAFWKQKPFSISMKEKILSCLPFC